MPPLTRQTPFRDLPGWDSVAHLAMLLGLERRLGLTFSAKQLTSLNTVGDLLDALP